MNMQQCVNTQIKTNTRNFIHYVTVIHSYIYTACMVRMQRQSIATPTKRCNEGESLYKTLQADMVWICKSGEWTPYK